MAAGTLGFADFFAQHNEHRILFPRLIFYSANNGFSLGIIINNEDGVSRTLFVRQKSMSADFVSLEIPREPRLRATWDPSALLSRWGANPSRRSSS
jgi:hypothetical protein